MRVFSKQLATVLAVAALSLSASSAAYAHDKGHGHGWWNFISSWFHSAARGFDHGKHEGHDRGHGHHYGLHKEHNPWENYADNDGDDDDNSGGGATTDTSGGGSTPPASTCSNGMTGTDVSFTVVDEAKLTTDGAGYGSPSVTYCSSNTVGDVITGSFPSYTTTTVYMKLCKNTYDTSGPIAVISATDCSTTPLGMQSDAALDPTATLDAAGVVDDVQNADAKVYLEAQ